MPVKLARVFDSVIQLDPETPEKLEQPPATPIPVRPVTPKPALPSIRRTIELNQKAIVQLQQESAQLQERLIVEAEEEEQEQAYITPISDQVSVTPMVSNVTGSAPEVDEDWQIITQQWQPEHWEIITLLYQEHYAQLTTVESKVHRRVSQLIDEINLPVDEQLGDLLVDPDTQAIFQHLHATAESLVRWYLSSK
jgi:hypothetical protein